MSQLKIVGLTGGIGAGKSAAAQCFIAHGVRLVDTDSLAHELTLPGGAAIDAIRVRFGHEFLTPDGALNRKRMLKCVFSDPAAKFALEGILHPLIVQHVHAAIAVIEADPTYGVGYAIVAVPLLFEKMSFRGALWRTLVIDCPVSVQVARVQARSGLSADEVLRIVSAQLPRDIRLQLADDVITNAASLETLKLAVSKVHAHYLESVAD
ncbi:MAG: dephospho-CoA kinase [Betaproteobacteria bacterium]